MQEVLVFAGEREVPPEGGDEGPAPAALEVDLLVPHGQPGEGLLVFGTAGVNFKNNAVVLNGTPLENLQGPGHGRSAQAFSEEIRVPEGVLKGGQNRLVFRAGADVSGAGVGARHDSYRVMDVKLYFSTQGQLDALGQEALAAGAVGLALVAAALAWRRRGAAALVLGLVLAGAALAHGGRSGPAPDLGPVPGPGAGYGHVVGDGVWEAPPATPGGRWLRVLHVNDLHGYAYPRSFAGEALPAAYLGRRIGSLFSAAAYLTRLRMRAFRRSPWAFRRYLRGQGDEVLFLHAGDIYGGTLYDAATQGAAAARVLADPLLDLDATCLGNHAWDYYDAGLRSALGILSPRVPVLSANVLYRGQPYPTTQASTILEVDGVRVGVVGLLTGGALRAALPSKTAGVEVSDPVAALRDELPRLRPRVDVVVALAHIGLERDRETAERLAALDDEDPRLNVDLVVDGHSHRDVQGRLDEDTVVVQADHFGVRLGEVLLELGPDRRPTGRVAARRLVLDAEAWPAPREMLERHADDLVARARIEDEVVAPAEPGFLLPALARHDPRLVSPCGDAVARAYLEHMRGRGLEVVAGVMNQGGVRTGVYATGGVVTRAAIHAVLPFGNVLSRLEVPGAALRRFVEAKLQARSRCSFAGLAIEYREGPPPAPGKAGERRLVSLGWLDGDVVRPIEDDVVYPIATSEYLAAQGFEPEDGVRREDLEETDAQALAWLLERLSAEPGGLRAQGVQDSHPGWARRVDG